MFKQKQKNKKQKNKTKTKNQSFFYLTNPRVKFTFLRIGYTDIKVKTLDDKFVFAFH